MSKEKQRPFGHRDPLAPEGDYQVVNEEVEVLLKELGNWLADKMPKGWGFNLLLFSFGERGSMFYLSNAQRADMIEAMKEFIAKQEDTNAA